MTPSAQADPPTARTGRERWWLLLWVIPVVAGLWLLLSFVGTMGHKAQRLAGTDSAVLVSPVVQIPGHGLLCQSTLVPKDATSVQLFVVPAGRAGPALDLRFTDPGGRTITTGRIAAGWTGGAVTVPVTRVRRSEATGRMCVRNGGAEPLGISGLVSQFLKASVNGAEQQAAVSILFYRDGSESWWSLLPTIAHRAGILKGAFAGGWSFWVALALLLAAAGVAVAVIARGARAA